MASDEKILKEIKDYQTYNNIISGVQFGAVIIFLWKILSAAKEILKLLGGE